MDVLSDDATLRRLLVQADVLSGAEALARYRSSGLPEALRGAPKPDAVLARLIAQVSAGDFSGGFGALWSACSHLWVVGDPATLEQGLARTAQRLRTEAESALRFTRAHGTGIAYLAPSRAVLLVSLAGSLEDIHDMQSSLAASLEQAEGLLAGVR